MITLKKVKDEDRHVLGTKDTPPSGSAAQVVDELSKNSASAEVRFVVSADSDMGYNLYLPKDVKVRQII